MRASFVTESAGEAVSLLHRLDVRTKMAVSLLASVAVVAFNHAGAMTVLAVASAVYALPSRRPGVFALAYLLVLCMWGVAIGMTAGMNLLIPKMPTADPARLLTPFLRTVVMLNVALALALSSRIQALLSALKTMRLPFCIYVPLAVMIRFLPAFIEDVRQIGECLRTRGHRLTFGYAVARPVLTVRLMMAPLLFRSLRSSDELGVAAELKGLGRARRITPIAASDFSGVDLLIVGLALVAVSAASVLQILYGSGGGLHG